MSGKTYGPMQDQFQYVTVPSQYNLRFCIECIYPLTAETILIPLYHQGVLNVKQKLEH